MYEPLQLCQGDILQKGAWRSDPKVPVLSKLAKLDSELLLIASVDPTLLQVFIVFSQFVWIIFSPESDQAHTPQCGRPLL